MHQLLHSAQLCNKSLKVIGIIMYADLIVISALSSSQVNENLCHVEHYMDILPIYYALDFEKLGFLTSKVYIIWHWQ